MDSIERLKELVIQAVVEGCDKGEDEELLCVVVETVASTLTSLGNIKKHLGSIAMSLEDQTHIMRMS